MGDDFDQGDFCPTEVARAVPHVWHESMRPAVAPALSTLAPTEAGRRALAELRSMRACGQQQGRERRQAAPAASWAAMPELYRRMVVAAAGVPKEVVSKVDRDLAEREKVMLRSAMCDMRSWLGTMVAL